MQPRSLFLALAISLLLFCAGVHASIGDRLPEFRQCVEVRDRLAAQQRRVPYNHDRIPELTLFCAGLQAGELQPKQAAGPDP